MAAGIASGFVRKLYRILDQESESIVGWDASGLSFSIHDSQQLNDVVLPRYFRGRMSAFRQQLLDHGFEQIECEDNEARECYAHPHFQRGCPDRLSYIVRNPKPKLKSGQNPPAQTHADHQQLRQLNQPLQLNVSPQQPSLGVHIAPSVKGPGRAPLTVTLTTGKRASPMNSLNQTAATQKRLRASSASTGFANRGANPVVHPQQGQLPAPTPPANLNRNPLFSNDSSTDLGLDVARVFSLSRISDSGVLPNSTDLPEPISYLTRLLQGNSAASAPPVSIPSTTSSVASSTSQSGESQMFSEDLMKSALYFLVSSSTTGINVEHASSGNEPSAQASEAWAARMERLSTSGFLSSLLVSSATGRESGNGVSSSVWEANGANPLFSRSTEQDEEEDSIWNLLLASSIDRVKTAVQDVTSPRERLRLILAERERLEEQRKRIDGLGEPVVSTTQKDSHGPNKPSSVQFAKPLKSALKKSGTNSLSTKSTKSGAKNLLFTQPTTSPKTRAAKLANPVATSNPLFSNAEQAHDSSDTEVVSTNPLFAAAGVAEPSMKTSASNVQKATVEATSTTRTAVSLPSALSNGSSSAEDGLWRLLMTSSVDWLRKGAAEFEV